MLGATAGARVFFGAEILSPGLGGIARVARMSVRALRDAGYQVTASALLDESPQVIDGLHASTCQGSRARFALAAQAAKRSHIRYVYDTVGTARAHALFTRRWRPYAAWVHGTEIWYNLHPAREAALRGATRIIANSAFCLQRFSERHWEIPNAVVCNLGTEDDAPPERMASFNGRPRVLILGTMSPDCLYKGHEELIAAWPAVISAVPEAELVIAGGGAARGTIEAIASRSPAAASIRFTGFVSEDGLQDLWVNSTVFAMPSSNEGFGLVYVEAMRHGLPVIASLQDAGQEINQNGITGYNINQNDKAALTERLIELLSDRDAARRMGAAGHAAWQDKYTYSAFRDRFLRAIA